MKQKRQRYLGARREATALVAFSCRNVDNELFSDVMNEMFFGADHIEPDTSELLFESRWFGIKRKFTVTRNDIQIFKEYQRLKSGFEVETILFVRQIKPRLKKNSTGGKTMKKRAAYRCRHARIDFMFQEKRPSEELQEFAKQFFSDADARELNPDAFIEWGDVQYGSIDIKYRNKQQLSPWDLRKIADDISADKSIRIVSLLGVNEV